MDFLRTMRHARLLALAFVVLGSCPEISAAQTRATCEWGRLDSARTAHEQSRHGEAIRLAESIAPNCPGAAYILFYSHRREGTIAAFRTLARPLAERGEAWFAYFLAMDLADHLLSAPTAARDLSEALRFFEIAHSAGNGLASQQLGNFYFTGRFSTSDVTEPRQSYSRAEQYFSACRHDRTVGRDCLESLGQTLLRQVARTGEALAILDSANALEALWAVHSFGLLRVQRDTLKARQIEIRIHAFRGSSDLSNTFFIAEFGKDLRAYRRGDARAAGDIGHRFNDGLVSGVPDDGPAFVKYTEEAVLRGNAEAASELADAYALGVVTRRDRVTAYMYYNVALDLGDAEVQARVRRRQENVSAEMTASEVTEAQRMTRELLARVRRAP